ncbi:MAG: DUF4912 domain-containing protein [Elusimicrobiota bacterium]|jgi:hypothetical protein|nr:DUF4912 domain-containing protein [Elusimicrobiota bacterium]
MNSSSVSSKISSKTQTAVVKVDYKAILPQTYNDTKIVLLPKDVTWVYSYWETSKETIENLSKTYGDDFNPNLAAIRVYDITGIDFDGSNANKFFDIFVAQALSWYINIGEYNRCVCVESGFFLKSGAFISVAKSNVLQMPRYGICDIVDETWGSLSVVEESLKWIQLGQGKSSMDFMKVMNKKWKEYSMMPSSFNKIK